MFWFYFLRKECDGMAYQRELKMYQMLEHQSVDFRYWEEDVLMLLLFSLKLRNGFGEDF